MARRPEDSNPRDTVVDARKTRLGVGRDSKPEMRSENLVGAVIGGYVVDELIGEGAMGIVYRAKHLDTNRVVALKALHTELVQHPKAVERFRREAKLASRLGHPHIGGVVELVETDGRVMIALELVEGEPLTSMITMPLPEERVLTIVGQLLRGLEHAHVMGLVHRDLKPDNVLVEWRNKRDHARIVDFGIAIVRDGSEEGLERLTATGEVVGTPLYMAPEQAKGAEVDHRADLYAVGMIMYEMIAGAAPFDGRPMEILHAKLRKDVPTFAERVPGLIVDPVVEQFCRKLLARAPQKRFQSARSALYVLKLLEKDRASVGVFFGQMDVAKALAVVSLPVMPAAKR